MCIKIKLVPATRRDSFGQVGRKVFYKHPAEANYFMTPFMQTHVNAPGWIVSHSPIAMSSVVADMYISRQAVHYYDRIQRDWLLDLTGSLYGHDTDLCVISVYCFGIIGWEDWKHDCTGCCAAMFVPDKRRGKMSARWIDGVVKTLRTRKDLYSFMKTIGAPPVAIRRLKSLYR